jgi:hypothetical protein
MEMATYDKALEPTVSRGGPQLTAAKLFWSSAQIGRLLA